MADHLPGARRLDDERGLLELVERRGGRPVDLLSGPGRATGRDLVGHLVVGLHEARRATPDIMVASLGWIVNVAWSAAVLIPRASRRRIRTKSLGAYTERLSPIGRET